MKGKPCKPPSSRIFLFPRSSDAGQQIIPDNESQASQDDQQHRRHIYERVIYVFYKTAASQDIDPGVTERRNRMKYRVPDSFYYSIFRNKLESIQQRPHSLYNKGSFQDS